MQWGPKGVRANAISPGLIRTGLIANLPQTSDFMQRRMQMTPLRRMGEVEEIAGAALFLASAAGGFVNGHNLVVDGGTTITDGSGAAMGAVDSRGAWIGTSKLSGLAEIGEER